MQKIPYSYHEYDVIDLICKTESYLVFRVPEVIPNIEKLFLSKVLEKRPQVPPNK